MRVWVWVGGSACSGCACLVKRDAARLRLVVVGRRRRRGRCLLRRQLLLHPARTAAPGESRKHLGGLQLLARGEGRAARQQRRPRRRRSGDQATGYRDDSREHMCTGVLGFVTEGYPGCFSRLHGRACRGFADVGRLADNAPRSPSRAGSRSERRRKWLRQWRWERCKKKSHAHVQSSCRQTHVSKPWRV